MLELFLSTSTAIDQSKAIFKIAEILDSLDEDARKHVLDWLRIHYFENQLFCLTD